MLLANNAIFILVPLLAGGVMVLMAYLTVGRYFKLWFRAYMSGVPITFFQVLGMSFRKIDPHRVVLALIMTRQAGLTLSCEEVEAAYLQGADVQKIAVELITAHRHAEPTDETFQQLVERDVTMRSSGLK